jgi:hypothetical protein
VKTKNLLAGCVLVGLMAGTAAWAGLKETNLVSVYNDGLTGTAYGSYGSARASADSTQYIGCTLRAYSNGTNRISCEARDANGNAGYCTSSSPGMVNAIMSQSGDAYLYFQWDETGTCTHLFVSTLSSQTPLQP